VFVEEELNSFLSYWYSGYMQGLASLDGEQQEMLLAACGRACAASYTAEQFSIAWQLSRCEMPLFLEELKRLFPEADFYFQNDHEIGVVYTSCGCDLVKNGWVKTPLHCRCSVHNLKENFKAVLKQEVKASLEESILAGDQRCRFIVSWGLDLKFGLQNDLNQDLNCGTM
jgi:hypothetical protein